MSDESYAHGEIEPKWREYWISNRLHEARDDDLAVPALHRHGVCDRRLDHRGSIRSRLARGRRLTEELGGLLALVRPPNFSSGNNNFFAASSNPHNSKMAVLT